MNTQIHSLYAWKTKEKNIKFYNNSSKISAKCNQEVETVYIWNIHISVNSF